VTADEVFDLFRGLLRLAAWGQNTLGARASGPWPRAGGVTVLADGSVVRECDLVSAYPHPRTRGPA
jgi:hypothetical protein